MVGACGFGIPITPPLPSGAGAWLKNGFMFDMIGFDGLLCPKVGKIFDFHGNLPEMAFSGWVKNLSAQIKACSTGKKVSYRPWNTEIEAIGA